MRYCMNTGAESSATHSPAMTATAYTKVLATTADFDQRPRPEWMLAPWKGSKMPALHIYKPVAAKR
jgi:hypothetical protein